MGAGKIPMHCEHCGKRYRGKGDWNAEFKAGVVLWLICPECQTPEQNAEAAINEATVQYGRNSFGQIVGASRGCAT